MFLPVSLGGATGVLIVSSSLQFLFPLSTICISTSYSSTLGTTGTLNSVLPPKSLRKHASKPLYLERLCSRYLFSGLGGHRIPPYHSGRPLWQAA